MSDKQERKLWTYEERDKLIDLYMSNVDIGEIAKQLGRSYYAVSTALSKFGGISAVDLDPSKYRPKKRLCSICRMPIFSAYSGYIYDEVCRESEIYRCA